MMIMMKRSSAAHPGFAAASACICLSGAASAQPVDDFESYSPGSFPGAIWQDPGLIDPAPPNPPDPSAIVVETIDAFGAPTRALSILDAIAPSQGIYTLVSPAPRIRMRCDVRIDQWCDVPLTVPDDWAMWLHFGLAVPGRDLCCLDEEVGVYTSALSREWRMWWNDAPGSVTDISLGQEVVLGVWYTIEAEHDVATGWTHTRIVDAASGATLVDRVDLPVSWAPTATAWDAVGFIDGELGAELRGNIAVVDNIEVDYPCYADCDGSGALDLFDFLCYQNLFAAGAARADCDGSSALDLFDFLCFQNGFGAGCP